MMSGDERMKMSIAAILTWMALTGTGYAQAPPPAGESSKGYVEGVAQSAFGNVTSQSFGVELGFTVASPIQVFVDVGYVRDAAPSDLGASALVIAGFLSQTQNNVTFRGKEPITFGLAGLRYRSPETNRYRYRLEGLDPRWYETNNRQRQATYTTLPSGQCPLVSSSRKTGRRQS